MNLKTLIVGGDFGESPKSSSVVEKFSNYIDGDVTMFNGGTYDDLVNISFEGYGLIIWLANVNNNYQKIALQKDKGACMIVSKVLSEERTIIDAITRIFSLRGNAVLAISKDTKPFTFKFVDALGNVWNESSDIKTICESINKFYQWHKESERQNVKMGTAGQLVQLNKIVADNFEKIAGRYFGNCSTRCSKMFPSLRFDSGNVFLFSKRNCDKKRLTTEDMVVVTEEYGEITYEDVHKPSVDTPVQIQLYQLLHNVNYFIHGHTYVKDAEFTKHYYPCGDLREVEAIYDVIGYRDEQYGVVNLKNHGFLMYANSIEKMREVVENSVLIEREVGYEMAEAKVGEKC